MQAFPISLPNGASFILDKSFISPDAEEVASGKVRINGVLVPPVSDKTDDDMIAALQAIKDAEVSGRISPERERELETQYKAAAASLPKKYQNHQWLHLVQGMVYKIFDWILMGAELDEKITNQDRLGNDTRRIKHFRKIVQDGSLFQSVAAEHDNMVQFTALSCVLHDPRVWTLQARNWEGYHPKLIAYAIRLLNESRAKLTAYKETLLAMGFEVEGGPKRKFQDLLGEWQHI